MPTYRHTALISHFGRGPRVEALLGRELLETDAFCSLEPRRRDQIKKKNDTCLARVKQNKITPLDCIMTKLTKNGYLCVIR